MLYVKYFYNRLRFKVVIDKSCRGHFLGIQCSRTTVVKRCRLGASTSFISRHVYSRRRQSREYSDHPRLCVCDSVCPLDRPKTKSAETKITKPKLDTGIVHHDTSTSPTNQYQVKRSKVKVTGSQSAKKANECPASSLRFSDK